MNNKGRKNVQKEEIKHFANRVLEQVKQAYGVDLQYGSINLTFHNGVCVRVMAEPKLKVCEMNEKTETRALTLAKKVS